MRDSRIQVAALTRDQTQIAAAVQLMQQLRTQLPLADIEAQINRQMNQGYQLLGAFLDSTLVGLAGYWCGEKLAWGKHYYVDDLVTDSKHRSWGVGKALLDALVANARAEGIHEIHLDSGVQRFAAHKFYLREGYAIKSHHFALSLDNA